MTLTCTRYSSQVLPNGRIQLQLDQAQQDPAEDKLLIPEIAELLKMSTTSVYRLSARKHSPIPLVRGKGRPYGFRSQINNWMFDQNMKQATDLGFKVFGS